MQPSVIDISSADGIPARSESRMSKSGCFLYYTFGSEAIIDPVGSMFPLHPEYKSAKRHSAGGSNYNQ